MKQNIVTVMAIVTAMVAPVLAGKILPRPIDGAGRPQMLTRKCCKPQLL